jgi:hypothetical protein
MSRRDYISFLGDNEWIWSTEPGWAMEEKLKDMEGHDGIAIGMRVSCIKCG